MMVELEDKWTDSRLLSPAITLTRDACLEFTARSDADHLHVTIVTEGNAETTAYFDEKGKTEGQVGLPRGKLRFFIGAVGHASLEKKSVVTLHDVRITMQTCTSNGKSNRLKKISHKSDQSYVRYENDCRVQIQRVRL